jgi:hypothetical protein
MSVASIARVPRATSSGAHYSDITLLVNGNVRR